MRIRHEGCFFAEDPLRPAHEARILFTRTADPFVLPCQAISGATQDADLLHMGCFSAVLRGKDAGEKVLLSDGLHNLRLDILDGSLLDGPVLLRCRFDGLSGIDAPLLTLRRLVAFHRLGRMPLKLYPRAVHVSRSILTARAWDAHAAGASQRDIAVMLFGARRTQADWGGTSDYLRSQVRRLLRKGNALVRGDWRKILRDPRA